MAFSRNACPPRLPLDLSLSPLLGGMATGILSSPPRLKSFPAGRISLATSKIRPRPKAIPPFRQDKPLPVTPSSPIPPKQIIALLDLLDAIEADITVEVQRVKESIREARGLVRGYKEERRVRRARFEKERREMKDINDNF